MSEVLIRDKTFLSNDHVLRRGQLEWAPTYIVETEEAYPSAAARVSASKALYSARALKRCQLRTRCDTCKRKKIRCSEFRLSLTALATTDERAILIGDWASARGDKCTYCRNHQVECNYTHGDREEKGGTPEACVATLVPVYYHVTR